MWMHAATVSAVAVFSNVRGVRGMASELSGATRKAAGLGRVSTATIVVNVDIASEDLYRSGDPLRQALADLGARAANRRRFAQGRRSAW